MKNTSITPGQKKQVLRFAEDAAEKALEELGLDNPGAQRVIEHGDEFSSQVRGSVAEALKKLSVSNQFADEEVQSSYAYPKGHKVKEINEQGRILKSLFSGFGCPADGLASSPLPVGAEGWFAIPRWEKIAPTYGEAVEKVFAMIASQRKFHNYREGQLGPRYLRQSERSVAMWKKLGDEQRDYNILVVPAQFGLRHKGRSVRRAREVFAANEFGLGAFAISIMLLTHPEREVQWEQLHVDCAGDEFVPDADGQFDCAPVFCFCGGRLKFVADWCGSARARYGSASGFLQQ